MPNMKKKTKLQTPAQVEEAKPRQHGPHKEKTQITVRVDQDLMNEVYVQMKEDNTRITDMVERGLILALAEAQHELPAWTKQTRFVLANATQEQVRLIRGLAIRMVEPHLADIVDGEQRKLFISHGASETGKIYELLKWFLEAANKLPYAHAALAYYSRYGKSPEEIAKLVSL
jgi:hypothetical protein